MIKAKTLKALEGSPRPYGLQIYAAPYTRITREYKATGARRTEYEKVSTHFCEGVGVDDPVAWLATLMCGSPPDDGKLEELPATPENAWFFVNMYKGLFALNERLKPFLGKDGINKLIAGKGRVLLPG